MKRLVQYSSVVAIIVLMLGIGAVKAQTTIEGIDYVRSGPEESVTVPFIPAVPGPPGEPGADAVVTTGLYSGLVELTVSGTGESSSTRLNDAFWVFTDGAHNPITPYNDSIWYQLNVSTQTLLGLYDTGFNTTTTPPTQLAKHKIVYDLDADTEVSPVYIPAYRSDNTYSIVVDLGTDVSSQVHFGVSDGIFSDNSGAYNITLYQLGISVEIDIKPETLNLQSKGLFTAFIELPEGYGEEDVDISTVECEWAPAVKATMANDNRLIVKFERKDLAGVSPGDDVVFTVTGLFIDGTPFIGTDCVVIIDNTKPLITSVVRDGVTEGQPTIVAGPSPGGLQEGSHAFMDRPLNEDDTRNYHWEGIPSELVGADYVMTYNEDKQPVYDPKVYNVSYSVTLGKAAKLYIFIDRRYVDAHGDPPFAWLTDGSSGAIFEDTALDIVLNEVGGRDVLQTFDVYGAEVPAGTYILGPSCDGNGSRNFYSIAAAKK